MPQITSKYIKEELFLTKKLPVSVTWVESPSKIYIRKLGPQSDNLDKLLGELKEHYETTTLPKKLKQFTPGVACAIRLEDTWNRAEIVEVIEKDDGEKSIKVYCVDTGCTISLDSPDELDSIQDIPYAYTLLNAQAVRISLMYVTPEPGERWSSKAFLILRNTLLFAKTITVNPKIKKCNGYYFGCIVVNGDMDISKLLKSSGCAKEYLQCPKNTQRKTHAMQHKTTYNKKYSRKTILELNLEEIESAVSDKSPTDSTVDVSTMDNSTSSSIPTQAERHPFMVEVQIQKYPSPDAIYVSQVSREDAMRKLVWAIQKFYNKYHSEPRDNWDVGDTCVVYSAKDKSYFRAKILEIKSPEEVFVYFYDRAYEETVTLRDIQVLHPRFAQEAAYCFKVKLAGILPCGDKPNSWPSLTISEFEKIIRENYRRKFYITKPVQEDVCNGIIPVELWVRQIITPGPFDPDIVQINSINRMLVEKGVALPIRDYFAKADTTLATEFEKHLKDNHQLVLTKEEVKWFNNFLLNHAKRDRIEELERSDDKLLCDSPNIDALTESLITNCTITDWSEIRNAATTTWLPSIPIEEGEFEAVPTYVDQQCFVYLHPALATKQLHFIQKELRKHHKNFKVNTVQSWKVGDICIARYHLDNQWYRGKIVKNLGNKLMVEYVDYGNVEECDPSDVTDNVRLGHIPIQCTKCAIGGLKSTTSSGKWRTCDLDQIHALLVDRMCRVKVLRRLPTHLIISITLLEPKIGDFSSFIIQYYNMRAAVEPLDVDEETNDATVVAKNDSTTAQDKAIGEEDTEELDTSQKSTSTYVPDVTNDNVLSGNLESSKLHLLESNDTKECDFEIDFHSLDLGNRNLICSTPQEMMEDVFDMYSHLTIPQDTKHIELQFFFNSDATTAIAQVAANNNEIFSKKLHRAYLRYKAMESELQTSASSQPLLQCFNKFTPCIAKFTDGKWYRCAIVDCDKIEDTQYLSANLYYIDYGNTHQTQLNLLSTDTGLRVPKDEWLQLPAMSITCKLWGLEYIGDDLTALATKLDNLYRNKVVAKIKENTGNELEVEVYKDVTCKEPFFAELIEEGFYRLNNPKIDDEVKTEASTDEV